MALLALDMDRTLSREEDGFAVKDDVAEALNGLAGRHAVVVVTGRRIESAMRLAGRLKPAAWILEGGALMLYGGRRVIAAPPDWPPHRTRIAEALRAGGYRFTLGEVAIYLDRPPPYAFPGARVVLNRGRAMVLPEGVDKGSGLLRLMELIGYKGPVVAVGDGENDLDMFRVADLKVAVANAAEEVKRAADLVLREDDGRGVVELVASLDGLLAGRLAGELGDRR